MNVPRGAATLALGMVAMLACSESAPEGTLHQLTPRAYAWESLDEGSSNAAIFLGDTAALVVDPGLTPAHFDAVLAAVDSVADVPVRFVVTTHWHPDHTLGAACTSREAARLVQHPKTRRDFAERGTLAARNILGPDGLARCRPRLADLIVASDTLLDIGNHRLDVISVGVAHTDGDLTVWSGDERVMAAGDLFLNRSSPAIGGGSVARWIDAIERLLALDPVHVVPGHFEPGTQADFRQFRDYLQSAWTEVEGLVASGQGAASDFRLAAFADFRQYPEYGATFADNAVAIERELGEAAARPGQRGGFEELARLEVGQNPHQIAFSADGDTVFVAAAGSDQITLVDAVNPTVLGAVPVTGTPLGVIPVPDGLIVSRFGSDAVSKISRGTGDALDRVQTGGAPSLFAPLPDAEYLVAVEQVDRVFRFSVAPFAMRDVYDVGDRPFPPAATSDGRLAFVPNYDDGTVTALDLWNDRTLATVPVGERPSGGVVLPDDIEYAVAVRGEDRVVFINTASRRVVGSLSEGIGASPFSVVLAPNGRLAFVNNTASHDVSVIALPEKRVIARVPTPEIPIVMAVHPDGRTLWVSSEGEHALTVFSIPEEWRRIEEAAPGTTDVAVLGMIHGTHRTSDRWGLGQLRETIRRIDPDVVCIEIPPDRWERIWSDFIERGVFEDDRIVVFPEYVDVLFPLQPEMGFAIEPCAGWTREMAQHRQARIAEFENDPAQADVRVDYERRRDEARAQYPEGGHALDDPHYLHSELYDQRAKADYAIYDEVLNDWIGPGGWTNINEAHWRHIARTVERHRGKRVLVTFGSSHKYWFLEQLRERPDVRLIDVKPFLP